MRKIVIAALTASVMGGVAFAAATTPQFVTLDRADMLSSNIVGTDVYDMNNIDLGKIQDVAFDANKAVKGYVLSVGGFLGMGSRYVAVDQASVAIKYDMSDKKWHAKMTATRDELKSAPEFKYEGEWNASKS